MNQNATQNAETAEENAERKKKKRKRRRRRRNGDQLKPTQATPNLGRRHRPRAIDPGRTANPGRTATQVAARLFLGFFFFFFFDEHLLLWGFFFLSSLMNTFVLPLWFFFFVFLLNVNRVLETWFSYRCHVEKVSHRTWTTHKNRALKARFRAQNRAFEARVAKNPYSL